MGGMGMPSGMGGMGMGPPGGLGGMGGMGGMDQGLSLSSKSQ